uniref:Uncharacterized protein n=1 Tax=Pyramimonas orientalis virus TaxID=455367 RepID=A0A7M3UNQ1_POV01|nr:hypothetical protein HWQ62_00189 [Pyramimonas orientalis virus]
MYWSQIKQDDEYNTPKELWDNIKDFLPGKDKVVWEAFYGNGKSGQILSDLGCTVIQSNVDFFDDNTNIIDKTDMIVSNVPFSKKKEILTKLKEINKPFILIMPASTMFTNYLREIFKKNEIQIIIPPKRMHFEKNGVVLKRTSFDCCYFCYKMDLKNDITWL